MNHEFYIERQMEMARRIAIDECCDKIREVFASVHFFPPIIPDLPPGAREQSISFAPTFLLERVEDLKKIVKYDKSR
jgi:hypothetical protein